MKYLITIGFCLAAGTVWADLGDTYATSCTRFGGRGRTDKETRSMLWVNGSWGIREFFYKNQCVCIYYNKMDGLITDSDIQWILKRNARENQHWQEYGKNEVGRTWVTNDEQLYAQFSLDVSINGKRIVQYLRVAYKSWLEGHGLLKHVPAEPGPEGSVPDEGTPAPVDEANSQTNT